MSGTIIEPEHVLLVFARIAKEPGLTTRQLAKRCGLTVRQAQRVVKALRRAGKIRHGWAPVAPVEMKGGEGQ